jgi:hypothetical protein
MSRILLMVILITVAALCALAGSNPKKAVAVRTTSAPKIDGVLDEPVWKLATPARDFIQQDPVEGAPASMPTEVLVLYDDEALYFGCIMHDADPSKIMARLARRDDEVVSDVISLRIDSYHDHQTNFEFTINAAGSRPGLPRTAGSQRSRFHLEFFASRGSGRMSGGFRFFEGSHGTTSARCGRSSARAKADTHRSSVTWRASKTSPSPQMSK